MSSETEVRAGPSAGNSVARELLTLLNPPENYFVPEGVDAEGPKLSDAAKAWFKNHKDGLGADNAARATKLGEQLKSLSIHDDGAVLAPGAEAELLALLQSSANEEEFANNLLAQREHLWAVLTPEIDGKKVGYHQNRYGNNEQMRDLLHSFGDFTGRLTRSFGFMVQNPYEQAKSAEIQAFRDAFLDEDNRPLPPVPDDADDAYIAGVAAQVFAKIKGTYQIDDADAVAEAAAKAEIARIIKSDEWKNASRNQKAEAMAEMFRTFAEGHPDIKAPTEGIDREDFVNGGRYIMSASGQKMFDMGSEHALTWDKMQQLRLENGQEALVASVYSPKYFPGMSS